MTEWIEVLKAITSVPTLSLRGVIRETRRDGERAESFMGNDKPLWAGVGDGYRVWRDGSRLRVESDEGALAFISDGATAWDFSNDPGRPIVGTPSQVKYFGNYQFLLGTREAADWSGDDFTKPTGPPEEVEFAGRWCWTVELKPPRRKPHPLRIWVDIRSGQILGLRSEGFGEGEEFTDLVVGEDLDDALFTWGGPTMTPAQHQDILQAQSRAVEREQAEWFAANVTALPLRARAWIDFTPRRVRHQESGAFDAHGDEVAFARRPRSPEGWAPDWGGAYYAWSTPEWDWAATAGRLHLDDESLLDLQQRLHHDEPVDRQRQITPEPRV